MIFRIHRYIIIVAFLSLPCALFSQFTYLDVSIGNKFMKISNRKEGYGNRYNQTNIHVNGLWRFRRHLGVGMTASIPVRQGGKFNILIDKGFTLNQYDMNNSSRQWNYFFTESSKFSLNGRIYGGIKGNFYIDGRISFFSFTENLTINTNSLNVLEKNTFNQMAPGFSIGMQPHLGKKVFMNLNLSWDFYRFKDIGFKNGNGATPEIYDALISNSTIVSFKSQFPDKKAAFSANIGLGYFF